MSNIKVSTIDRQSLHHAIRPALDKKLKELSEELGIQITAGRATYDPNGETGSFKLNLLTVQTSEDGEVLSLEQIDYKKYHQMYGLPEDGLGMEIEICGEKLKIAGLRMRARKNNVLLDTCDGSGTQRIAPAMTVKDAVSKRQTTAA